jgi:O-antigen/teichoic acid export membrane protein
MKFNVVATSGTVLARFAVVAAGLTGAVITSRMLGPAGRGQYFAITTVAVIAAQLGNLGLSSSNVVLAARDHARAPALLANSVWMTLALALVMVSAALAAGDVFASTLAVDRNLLWAACVIGPATLLISLASSVLIGTERFALANGWQVLNGVATIILLAIAAALHSGVGGFLVATCAGAAITVLLPVAAALWRSRVLGFSTPVLREGVGLASRAYLALLVSYLMQRSAVLLLAGVSGPEQIGLYSIAAQGMDVLIILPTSVGLVILPALVRQPSESWQAVCRAAGWIAVLMSGVCLLAGFCGYWLVPLVFGPAFGGAYPVFLAILPAVLAVSITTVLSQYLVAQGFPLAIVFVWLCGLAVMTAAGLVLAARWHALGAALAQSAGAIVVLIGMALLARRTSRAHNAPLLHPQTP